MTFRAERYPKNWPAIRATIRERAGDQCECTGQCGDAHDGGRCAAPNGETITRDPRTPARWRSHTCGSLCTVEDCGASRVVITVAHVDHDESNNEPGNLLALCQRCHLRMDAADNAARRRERLAAAAGQPPLPGLAAMPEHRGQR
jgi:5-methylcytosine-specific restriction endonuclease McrA